MNDLVKYGLLGAGDQKDAALMALFNLGAQIGNRSAPRLTPTPPALDMSKVMGVYQNTLTNAMKRRALVKKLEDREKRRSFFDAKAIDPVAASQIAIRGGVQQAQKESQQPEGAVNVETAKYGEELLPEDFAQYDAQRAMETAPNYLKAAEAQTTIPSHLSFLDPAKARALMGFGQKFPEMGMKAYSQFLTRKPTVIKPASQLAKLRQDRKLGFISEEEYNAGVKKLLSPPRTFSASKSVASATDPGTYVGEYYQDTATGKQYVRTKDGVIPFDPAKHVPQNRSYLQKEVISADRMHKLDVEITEKENAMRQVSIYLKDLKLTNQGVNRMADYISTTFKTLFTSKRLSKKELNLAASEGRLQALLGRFRIDVVGPGVMTEYDAQRVIAALGGFPGIPQNLEVAQKLLKEILGRSIRTYKTNLNQYHRQVKLFYGRRAGYQTRKLLPLANQPSANDPLGILR